ncbi:MAG: alcohol dehydrogenase catalytic domain-containing protein, partial [SAR202 cluster bacterium]|nr:alcohol dehydrogenase catalytic domain-containing protein [SAR202 cluster bacterium]
MKAIQITETGGPEVMKYIDLPDPEPGAGQALIDIQAVGVNFTDVYGRAGVNPPASLPWIPGVEGAGVVSAIGDGVSEVAVGEVVAYSGVPGSYAEKTVAPAAQLVKMPDDLDANAGATAMLQGMTAHYLCHTTYPIQTGDIALVHAGAGGVGLILTQMVKFLGGTVISTVSTEAKAQLSRDAGADHVINYVEEDFEARVNEITGG